MNSHEERAWKQLVALGAKEIELFGKPALDLREIRVHLGRSIDQWAGLIDAIIQVSGRSGTVRRHQDRAGRLVFVVRDPDKEEPKTLLGAMKASQDKERL